MEMEEWGSCLSGHPAMARVMALLEMALFLWLVSDTSSSLEAAAWFLKRAAVWANTSACAGREGGRKGGREGVRERKEEDV